MHEKRPSRQELAIRIAKGSSEAQREAMHTWLGELLEIRSSNLPSIKKAKAALAATLNKRVIWPVVVRVAKETKRVAWDERTKTARFGLGGAAAGVALFGGQSAGLAALGTAVGVPLWVVFGAGSAFARVLYEELSPKSAARSDSSQVATSLDARRDADGIHRTHFD